MRIKKQAQPLQPRTNYLAKAEEIKMKIANIIQLVESGYISPEEGKVIIENLQAQLAEVNSKKIEEPTPSYESVINIETNEDNKKPNKEFGKDDFYSQQAAYNKGILGLI